MENVKECLFKSLAKLGIQDDMISDMEITTGELGLNSLELVNIAVNFFEEFGVKLKLLKSEDMSLNQICTQVASCCGM